VNEHFRREARKNIKQQRKNKATKKLNKTLYGEKGKGFTNN
jgi:hypothetical protein